MEERLKLGDFGFNGGDFRLGCGLRAVGAGGVYFIRQFIQRFIVSVQFFGEVYASPLIS